MKRKAEGEQEEQEQEQDNTHLNSTNHNNNNNNVNSTTTTTSTSVTSTNTTTTTAATAATNNNNNTNTNTATATTNTNTSNSPTITNTTTPTTNTTSTTTNTSTNNTSAAKSQSHSHGQSVSTTSNGTGTGTGTAGGNVQRQILPRIAPAAANTSTSPTSTTLPGLSELDSSVLSLLAPQIRAAGLAAAAAGMNNLSGLGGMNLPDPAELLKQLGLSQSMLPLNLYLPNLPSTQPSLPALLLSMQNLSNLDIPALHDTSKQVPPSLQNIMAQSQDQKKDRSPIAQKYQILDFEMRQAMIAAHFSNYQDTIKNSSTLDGINLQELHSSIVNEYLSDFNIVFPSAEVTAITTN